METSKLLDAEFKTLVIRMLIELSENLNSIKKGKSEMIVLALMKNTTQGINSGVDEAGDEVKDLEVKEEENNQNSKK